MARFQDKKWKTTAGVKVCAKFAVIKRPESIMESRVATDVAASSSGRSAGMQGN